MRVLFENLPLKLVSLGLAVLLWFVIAGEKTSEMGLLARLELQNFPKDLELTGDPVNAVDVRIRASPSVIQRLAPGEVSAVVDLAGTLEGERIIHLTPETMRIPFGVKVVKITPAIITLNFERTLQKQVPVRPRLIGRPGAHFEVAEVAADPADVRIAGPKSRVQEIESAFTEPVSVDGARATVTDEVNIGLEDPVLRIQGSPRVKVTARVAEVQEDRVLEDVRVELRGAAGATKPATVDVLLHGPASIVQKVPLADVRAWIEGAKGDSGKQRVKLELAPGHPGVTAVAAQPAEVVPVGRPD